ncbi:MAG: T9SS type A sorting domain-containing protein [Ignavibacteria bacterium]|jgi:BNR/Asp-box repeat.|nr:MAG: T9SS C-terminal target domain-containing protein [Chlorobiota bacterium]MBV6397879.1 hypothetical protein [Ignavibacteria bacterium]MCC6886826.1 T9SS type A sorting domain-containing protein [Ignavibacteriales bacterium]MCE7953950.1 T9SS C-terminal target domain-containing protein [Chlorobi bacterium CHB7]OQY76754.1 MAG: hypothetical protein B6D43_08990 [Ignavibacteriales bacterium UTCHB1]RIK47684.1 MAG: hypothetical protein DCC60_09895 [Ignavibacteriota bacterium]
MKYFFLLLFLTNIYQPLSAQPLNDIKNQSRVIVPPDYSYNPNQSFEESVTINGFDNFFLGIDYGEPHIATNPRDPLNSITAYNINNYYYTLNGYDWIKTFIPFPGFSVIGDPVLTFDSLGNAYYLQMYQNGSTYGLTVARSTNKGVSYHQYSSVHTFPVLNDKPWITADQTGGPYSNNLYVGWRQFGATGMRFSRSTDFGLTWSPTLTLLGTQGAYVAVGPNGNIQGGSVYFASVNGNTILMARSTNGGVSFSSSTTVLNAVPAGTICSGRYTVKNCIRTNNFPRVAVDNSFGPYRGTIYVVTEINPANNPNDLADVVLVRSTDNGQTWSSPLRLNDDNTSTDQWMPAISVDNNTGKVFVCWYDSRVDPGNNLMTELYGAVSTNGGVSFSTNEPISNEKFNPDDMRVSQGSGQAFYIGDYIGISAIGNTSYSSWMDGRNNSLGSYVAYFPDFAMLLNTDRVNTSGNSSASVTVKIPDVKGPFADRVKFTATIDSTPASGNISFSFTNGKDSITSFPDSVVMNVNLSGNVTPGRYEVTVTGSGKNGTPVHKRKFDLLVDASIVKVATNRGTTVTFYVNGQSYNSQQEFVFVNGSNVTIKVPDAVVQASNKYKFTQWSNGSTDTTINFNVSTNLDLIAHYKRQYLLLMNSSIGNTFGGNEYYDSNSQATFGVLSRIVSGNGLYSEFKGWIGGGSGSYSSPDSSGTDTVVTVTIKNPIVQTARWYTIVGISNVGDEIPEKYNLSQNYPNPFNPVTNIRFDIIKAGNVKLSVYDITGKEVSVLTNEVLKPGSYEVKFDASQLSSGVYYYKIEAGEFVSIKRMVLLK